jgi:hypothetical protein
MTILWAKYNIFCCKIIAKNICEKPCREPNRIHQILGYLIRFTDPKVWKCPSRIQNIGPAGDSYLFGREIIALHERSWVVALLMCRTQNQVGAIRHISIVTHQRGLLCGFLLDESRAAYRWHCLVPARIIRKQKSLMLRFLEPIGGKFVASGSGFGRGRGTLWKAKWLVEAAVLRMIASVEKMKGRRRGDCRCK